MNAVVSDKLTLDDIADFTWLWNHLFFLETAKGNYVWSNPEYEGGDNKIHFYAGSLDDWLKAHGILYGRDKGRRHIRSYCGDNVVIYPKPL